MEEDKVTIQILQEKPDFSQEEVELKDIDNEMSYEANQAESGSIMEQDEKLVARRQKVLTEIGEKLQIESTRSNWAQALLYLNREPFRLTDRDYLKQIYNLNYPDLLLKFSRQTEKSTSISTFMVIDAVLNKCLSQLYVSPTADQTRTFSSQKIKPLLEESPMIKKFFINSAVEAQVFNKGLINGSKILLRYAFLTADRCRGISASRLYIDEIQDLLWDNIPVILEVLSHAIHPRRIYSGTPKTFENPIEKFWQDSSQCEWLVPCEHHTPVFYNLLDLSNIGKKGVICKKCGHLINTTTGKWVKMNTNPFEFMGFRVPQIMVPWKQSEAQWYSNFISPMEGGNAIDKGVYLNEKLAISSDNADKPISREDIMRCCDHTPNNEYGYIDIFKDHRQISSAEIFCGVDWGTGQERETPSGKKKYASYSVMTLMTRLQNGKKWYFYQKRFKGAEADPVYIKEFIQKVYSIVPFRMMAVDWGFGWGINNDLFRMFPDIVMQIQYVPRQRNKKKWDRIGYKWQVNRSLIMSEFFHKIRQEQIQLPSWEQFEPYAKDLLSIFNDYSMNPMTRNELFYNHPVNQPDDACHSMILAEFAHDIYFHVEPIPDGGSSR